MSKATFWGSIMQWGRGQKEGQKKLVTSTKSQGGKPTPGMMTMGEMAEGLSAAAEGVTFMSASEEWWDNYRKQARPKYTPGYPEKIASAMRRLYPTVEDFLGNSVDRSDVSQDYWLGVLIWVEDTRPRVTYKGQPDKARHFAYGAWAEASASLGYRVGRWKEMLDEYFGTGQADPADEQATCDGADAVRGVL